MAPVYLVNAKIVKKPITGVIGGHLGFLEKAPGGFFWTLWELIKGVKKQLS